VRRPRTGFRSFVRVRFQECDPFGHVNNTVYLGYLEQAAVDHAAAGGWPAVRLRAETGALFLARQHVIDFHRPAYENDVLEIQTWPEEMSGARAFRAYEVRRIATDPLRLPPGGLFDGVDIVPFARSELIVSARTEWAFVDVERGRPVRIPDVVIADFLEDD
jgi:acyl-CoA thioester hydrolase